MSLDQNLFTLVVTPNKDDPNVLDLVDPSGTAHYRKQRVPGSVYKVEVYDPMSESLLITATAPASTSKVKTLELCNPTLVVELKYTGTLTFRWGFKWEEHEFEWRREECFMLRKPDPPVLVAITKEPPGRLKTTSIQILDYNLNRFDIDDRKGLEIVILTALLTFQDSNDTYHAPPREEGATSGSIAPLAGLRRMVTSTVTPPSASPAPPPPPPRPAPKTGVDRIAEMQAIRGEYNEITVEDEGSVQDYAQHCSNLLQDDAMLFVTVRSSAAEHVPKVLQVVEQTKRIRHKAGLSDDEELHQYVLYDTIPPPAQKGPRRIVLDDSDKDKSKSKNKYTPPNSLTIHLSKIPMPELQPKASANDKPSKKDGKKAQSASPSPPPPNKPAPAPAPALSKPAPNKLNRPARSSSPASRVQAHQTHPNPTQPPNPTIYTGPPPQHPSHPYQPPYPHSPHSYGPPASSPSTRYPKQPQPQFSYPQGPAEPSLYGPYAPPLHTPSPYAGARLHAPGPNAWQPQPSPLPPSASQQPAGGGQPRPTTVVSGLFDMLNRL